MSAIAKCIAKVLEVQPKRNEDRQDFIRRVVKAINDAPDADYNALSKETIAWYNDVADVVDANKKASKQKPLPDFPDLEEAGDDKAEEAPARRRGADKEEAKPESAIKIGTEVTVIKKNGREVTGKLVERDKDVLVLEVDGKEREIEMDDVGAIEQVNGAGKGKADEPEGPAEPQPGDTVAFKTKRGREVEGVLVSMDADKDEIVVKTEDGEEDFALSRIDGGVSVTGGKKANKKEEPKDEPPARAGRRSAAAEPEAEGKAKRTTNPKGVSVGQRVKELLAEDPDMELKDVLKALTADGIEHKEVTVEMNVSDCKKFIAELRKAKRLK